MMRVRDRKIDGWDYSGSGNLHVFSYSDEQWLGCSLGDRGFLNGNRILLTSSR